METTSSKRPSESDHNEETFAVCTNCSRLSYNLKTCDKCGSTLSEDNTPVCSYVAEPKRARVDAITPATSNTSTETSVNGKNTTMNGDTSKQINPAPNPVPQALYVNKNAAAAPSPTSGDVIRPHALYVNLNNQAFPLNRIQDRDKTRSPNRAPAVSSNQSYTSAPPPYSSNSLTSSGMPPLPSLNQPSPVIQGLTRSQSSTGMVAVLNSQPLGSLTQPTTASYIPMSQSSSSHASNIHASQTQRPTSSVQSPLNSTHPTVDTNCITLHAHQIRIGTRKFRPVSPVTIKDDGILFTLKDYTFAPVLLNARAIIKCKLLFTRPDMLTLPIIFLYLENSCMRQIRNIFSLQDNEFSETSAVNIRKCITIFPIIPPGNKQLNQQLSSGVKRIFDAMLQRYPRVGNIMEEITAETVIDLLYGSTDSPSVGQPSSSSASNTVRPPALSHQQHMSQVTAPDPLRQTVMHNPSQRPSSLQSRPQTSSTVPPITGNRSAAPLLTIPNEQSKWVQMQKSLVIGGVYHVQTGNGRKYCLWNGTNLVPCVVQNSEVQLSCSNIRIGTMVGQPHGQVKVRMDPPAGISFAVKTPKLGIQEIMINLGDIVKCEVCFERVVALFIYPTWVAGQRLAQKLGLSKKQDPTYDPHSGEDRRKYLILFLKDVNQDQREALLQMKATPNNKAIIEEIDVLAGRSILTKIKRNTLVQSKMDSYLGGQDSNNVAHQSLESLAREVTHAVSDQSSVQKNAPGIIDDDDDDDVIMTSEEVGVKCPYTQQVMKEPVRNKVCGHNYEKMAIHEFIVRKKGNAKCPYAGCGNQIPLRMEDLIPNQDLRKYILENYK